MNILEKLDKYEKDSDERFESMMLLLDNIEKNIQLAKERLL